MLKFGLMLVFFGRIKIGLVFGFCGVSVWFWFVIFLKMTSLLLTLLTDFLPSHR